jgi:RNA polymerase sigma-70 factor (ECF subfamily)
VSCNREHAAFVQHLFETYRAALLRHVRGLLGGRSDAEDIVQETCTRLLAATDLDRIEARARSYMFRIATNLAIDRHRRPREASLEAIGDDIAAIAAMPGPDAIVDAARALEMVTQTLLQLRPRSRQVFLLRSAEGLSYEAISERLGISKRTVEREMQHALDACQRKLKRSME